MDPSSSYLAVPAIGEFPSARNNWQNTASVSHKKTKVASTGSGVSAGSSASANLFINGKSINIGRTATAPSQKRKSAEGIQRKGSPQKRRQVSPGSPLSIEKLLKSYRTSHRELLGTLNALEETSNESSVLDRIESIKQGLRQARVDLSFLRAHAKEPPAGTQSPDSNATSHEATDASNKVKPSGQETARGSSLSSDEPVYRLSAAAVAEEEKMGPFRRKQVFWSHRLYRNNTNQAPLVQYCATKDDADKALSHFLKDNVVGIDTEYPSHKKPIGIKEHISLVQIANENRIVLVHIARFDGSSSSDLLPKNFARLLEDHRIIKTGASILNDCTRIENQFGVMTNSICEISHYYKLVRYCQRPTECSGEIANKMSVSLETQVQEHLELPMFKEEWLRRSRWDLALSEVQKEYAAADAYATFQLYQILERKRKNFTPAPPRPMFSEYQTLPKTILFGTGLTIDEVHSDPGFESFFNNTSVDDSLQEACQPTSTFNENMDSGGLNVPQPDEQGPEAIHFAQPPQIVPDDPPPEPLMEPQPSPSIQAQTNAQSLPSSSSIGDTPGPRHPDMCLATTWARSYRSSLSPSEQPKNVKELNLMAYYLWHIRKIDLDTITKIWRRPPILPTTVACHVEKAVFWGKLPHDIEKYEELLQLIPDAWRVSLGSQAGDKGKVVA